MNQPNYHGAIARIPGDLRRFRKQRNDTAWNVLNDISMAFDDPSWRIQIEDFFRLIHVSEKDILIQRNFPDTVFKYFLLDKLLVYEDQFMVWFQSQAQPQPVLKAELESV